MEGAGSMLESVAGVLLFCTIPNGISQVGTLPLHLQQVVTDVFRS